MVKRHPKSPYGTAGRKPTSIALEEDLLIELKAVAGKKGVPYQVLMRLLIADGLKRLKAS